MLYKDFDYSKYDEESRKQLKIVHLTENLQKVETELSNLSNLVNGGLLQIQKLDARIDVLEEVRERQKDINDKLLSKNTPEPKSFWDLIFKR